MPLRDHSFGVLGALSAMPLRVAAHRVAERQGRLHRGIRRRSTHIVIGRSLLERYAESEVESRVAEAIATGLPVLSEDAFLRLLRPLPAMPADLSRHAIIDQSRIGARVFDHLALFDAFERHAEPFSFRDLILARKYAGLIATGASWSDIARSVHQIGPVASLTALTLQPDRSGRIVSRDPHSLAELNGQRLLPLDDAAGDGEDYFGLAEQAEEGGLLAEAATLYRKCLAIDPGDATAAFNLGNCERELGDTGAATLAYSTAIKRDPEFVEAWFNLGHLYGELGKVEVARRHLRRAVELDSTYADAIYNLGALEYDAEAFEEARHWWRRYLELDAESEWAKRARAGIAIIDRQLRQAAAGRPRSPHP
jgi:tetratricopeptide (TPR) repeat protein